MEWFGLYEMEVSFVEWVEFLNGGWSPVIHEVALLLGGYILSGIHYISTLSQQQPPVRSSPKPPSFLIPSLNPPTH